MGNAIRIYNLDCSQKGGDCGSSPGQTSSSWVSPTKEAGQEKRGHFHSPLYYIDVINLSKHGLYHKIWIIGFSNFNLLTISRNPNLPWGGGSI